jgi:hypothetical protein
MKFVAFLFALCISQVASLSAACEKGSDEQCLKFGENFCCAYIDIKSDKDQLRGYWCADKKYARDDYEYAGYSGKIICSEAETLRAMFSLVVVSVISLLLIC